MTTNSTGPRSEEGKAASSLNALKHGIFSNSALLPCENAEERQSIVHLYLDRWQPSTPEELLFVETLIHDHWILRRLRRAEDHLWDPGADPCPGDPAGPAFEKNHRIFGRLQYRITATERSFKSALHELERLKALREEQARAAQTAEKSKDAPPAKPVRNEPPKDPPKKLSPYRDIPESERVDNFDPIDPDYWKKKGSAGPSQPVGRP